MGNMLKWNKPETGTSWTYTRVYRATSETGSYSALTDVLLPTTQYFDIAGLDTHWYKIAWYDSVNMIESPLSNAIESNQLVFLVTPTELRQWMLMGDSVAGQLPTDTELAFFIQQANTRLGVESTATYASVKKLLLLNLSAATVMCALASKALSKGYLEINIDGATIRKPFQEFKTLEKNYITQYQTFAASVNAASDIGMTTPMSVIDATSQQDIIDVFNGVSDGFDFQSRDTPSQQDRRNA